MKEYAPRTDELTAKKVSSTLDRRSTMDKGQNEQERPSASNRRSENTPGKFSAHAQEASAQFQRVSQVVNYLKNNPEVYDAINKDPNAFMRYLSEQENTGSLQVDQLLQNMGLYEHSQDKITREQIVENQYSQRLDRDYDVKNQLGGEPSEEERNDEIEKSLQPQRRGEIVRPVNPGMVTDSEFRNILSTYNRDAGSDRMRRSDEYALQHVQETIKKITDRINNDSFPASQRDAALDTLESLKDTEIKLITSSQRERSPQEMRQIEVYNMSQEFDKKYAHLIEAERRGQQLPVNSPEVSAYRGARQYLVKQIEKQIEEAPSIEASRFPPLVMEMASKFTETREMLINEILFKPYADKTQQGHYEINLYASGNLDELLATLARRAKNPAFGKDREAYEWYQALKTTSRNFWEMNRGLWTGNLEVFSRIAEEMNYDQFETMQRISGVGEVMRLYDEKFMRILARDHRINSKNLEEIKRMVREEMIKLNDQGVIQSDYYHEREGTSLEKRKLQKWELDRAINVGFVFFNITFRGPEIASLSQLETGERRFASFPYENASRMLNLILTADRFGIGSERGGMDFMDRARANNVRLMEDDRRHLKINRFKEINGISVSDLEWMAAMGISGIFSGWRMSTMAYEGIEVVLGEGQNRKVTNLWEYMKVMKMSYRGNGVEGVQGVIDAMRKDESLSMEQKQNAIVRALDPLIGKDGNLDVGLGMLLRLGQGNQGKGGFLSGEEGFQARKAIWERIAKKNPLMAANILTNLVDKNEKEYSNSLKNILARKGWTINGEKWELMRSKLQIKHEMMIKQQAKDPEDRKYAEEMMKDKRFQLTPEEQAVLNDIATAGESISGDLADIVFPYMTFMNDMPFEKMLWTGPGAQFFKRRIGDIGSYNKAIGAATGLMGNLGGMKPEDVVKGLKELQQGIESPNGPGSGWTAVLPFVLAYMEMAQTYRGWESQGLVKGMRQNLNKPTSILQEYVGVHAPSMDESAAYDFLHTLRHEGIIDHYSEEIIRKYRKLSLFDILFSLFRDLAPIFVTSILLDTPKQTINLK